MDASKGTRPAPIDTAATTIKADDAKTKDVPKTHKVSWSPRNAFERRQSWNPQDQKHEQQMQSFHREEQAGYSKK